jgi:chemotaxis protein methyltransferase CheR
MREATAMRSVPPPPVRTRPLRRREFDAIRTLVYREAGIHLAEGKHALVEARLARRLKELGLPSYEAYCELVTDSGNEDERTRMLDCITTNETQFFREPHHFDLLENVIFPKWKEQAAARLRPKRLRVWSAACSTGEEAYSLAMCLLRAFPRSSGWDLDILASDLSTRVLAQARSATWPIDKARSIPEQHLKEHMLRGVGPEEGKLRCGPEARNLVRFARLNLNHPPFAVPLDLDLIFCRNVLIYFDAASKARVIEGLLDRLDKSGYLFVGHSETLHGVTRRVSLVAPSVYQLKSVVESR